MYQSIYYDIKENEIHLWDDERGYVKEDFSPYQYGFKTTTEITEYKSLYGDYVKKIYPEKYGRLIDENNIYYETDIEPMTRFLIDNYNESEEVSKDYNVLYYDIETEMVERKINVETVKNRVTSIAVHYTKSGYRAVYVLNLNNEAIDNNNINVNANLFFFNSEAEMFLKFLSDYTREKPHAMSGWNTFNFDTPYLYNRIKLILGRPHANRLSPIGITRFSHENETVTIAGVTSFDYMFLYKKFNNEPKSSYSLENISQIELGKGKIKYEGNLDTLFKTDINKFIEYNLNDIDLVLELNSKLNYIELSRMICHMSHVTYDAITHPSRYIDGAILSYLRKNKIVAPNTVRYPSMKVLKTGFVNSKVLIVDGMIDTRMPSSGLVKIELSKSAHIEVEYERFSANCFYLTEPLPRDAIVGSYVKVRYAGAYVKDPVPGLYDWVFSIDATSLYPSIIRTLKITPEAKAGKILEWNKYSLTHHLLDDKPFDKKEKFSYIDNNVELIFQNKAKKEVKINKEQFVNMMSTYDLSIASNGVLYYKDKLNVLPNILTEWFNLRLEYKKKAKEANTSELYDYYDNRQLVVKILLNSVYGVLGMPGFRFYDLDNAEAITLTGQDVIKYTAKLINNLYRKKFNNNNDSVIYGDTDSAYIQIPPEVYNTSTEEGIISYADEVCDLANKGLAMFSEHALCTTDSALEFKREKVCRRAFFIAKKRYGLYVIDNEGKKVEKVSVTGIDIKRSSYPKFFAGVLSNVLLSILKGKNKNETDKIVLDAERDINEVDIFTICKTSSIKDLDSYEIIGNGFSPMKGVPAHGKAAVRYNSLLNLHKCESKYTPITSTDKIKWCYLIKNTYGIESIALKNENVPDVILDFAKKNIDRKKMYETELKTKILIFYNVLNWKYPNKMDNFVNEFF